MPANIGAMRDLWRAVANVGDAEFVTANSEDETVRIARTGDPIHLQVEECGEDGRETVDIRLAVAVIDALLSGDGETRDVHAAVERLGELRGDIVRVSGDDHQVRVWVDESREVRQVDLSGRCRPRFSRHSPGDSTPASWMRRGAAPFHGPALETVVRPAVPDR